MTSKTRGRIPSIQYVKGTTWGTIADHPEFRQMWAFLHAHGERFIFDRKLDTSMGKKEMHGKCIMEAHVNRLVWQEKAPDSLKERMLKMYAEGLSSVSPTCLHAWNVLHSTRHAKVFDRTWEVDADIEEKDVWYQGVLFDEELFEWVRFKQRAEGFQSTAPYLTEGCCVLTYKPLLDGTFADYPMRDEDYEASFESLVKFIDASMRVGEIQYANRNRNK
jgi:hypothetical protein